jgi:hypothetical protein
VLSFHNNAIDEIYRLERRWARKTAEKAGQN